VAGVVLIDSLIACRKVGSLVEGWWPGGTVGSLPEAW